MFFSLRELCCPQGFTNFTDAIDLPATQASSLGQLVFLKKFCFPHGFTNFTDIINIVATQAYSLSPFSSWLHLLPRQS